MITSIVDARKVLWEENTCGPTRALYVQLVDTLRSKSTGLPTEWFEELDRAKRGEQNGVLPGDDLYEIAWARWQQGASAALSSSGLEDEVESISRQIDRYARLETLPDRRAALRLLGKSIRNVSWFALFFMVEC